MYGTIPFLFDFRANQFVHLLLLKNSMALVKESPADHRPMCEFSYYIPS